MEKGPRLIVSSDRLVKPGIESATPGLQGMRFIHYTTVAPKGTGIVPERYITKAIDVGQFIITLHTDLNKEKISA